MRPSLVDLAQVQFDHEHFFAVGAGLGQKFTRKSRDEALPPELDTVPTGRLFQGDGVGNGDVAAVRNRMTALDDLPRLMLDGAQLLLFSRMPPDGGGVEQNLRAL